MPDHGGKQASRADGAIAAIAVLLLLLIAAAFWPGILTWDAIRQYGQALSGRYDDWHPPAMNWLWRRIGAFGGGPAPMMLLQAALYAGGLGLFVSRAWRRGRQGEAAAIAVVGLLPIPLVLMATVLKDSLMAGALVAAAGLAARRPFGRDVSAALALALLLGAATLRFNALPACLPLAVAALPERWTDTRGRLALAGLLVAIPLAAALPLANRLLHAAPSGVGLSLPIYDLGGVTRFSGADAFPPLGVTDPVAVNDGCYSPVSWDSYAWWDDDPCPIGFATIRSALAARRQGASGWWLRAIARHPLAYAEHRLAHFNRNTRFWAPDADEPGLSLHSDPNPWGYQVSRNRWEDALGAAAARTLRTPLGWPCVWLALALGTLILVPGLPRGSPATPLLLSALFYGFSYLPLSVASEARYHLWTMLAAGIAAAIAFSEAAAPTARRLAAITPAVVVAGLAIAARLALQPAA